PGWPSMPQGWSVTPGQAGSLEYSAASVSSNNSTFTLLGVDGETYPYQRVGGGTSFTPPAGEDDVVAQATDGTYTVHAASGLVYTFNSTGQLQTVTSTPDDRSPAAAKYTWSGAPLRITQIADGAVPSRTITLRYYNNGTGSCPTPASGSGFDGAPPTAMLCEIDYWDSTSTFLWYQSGQLARIENPGSEVTDFGYTSGKLNRVRAPLAADIVAANERPTDCAPTDTTSTACMTLITYDGNGNVSSVAAPAPASGANRPTHTYTYPASNDTRVAVSGITSPPAGYFRRVIFDGEGRLLTDYDANGLATQTVYSTGDLVASVTDPAGFTTATAYDTMHRPTDTYGPAPSSWFFSDGSVRPGYYPAHATTAYDQNLSKPGLAATFWNNTTMGGAPTAHATGMGTGGSSDGSLTAAWG